MRDASRGRRGVNRDTSSARHPGGASRSSHGFLATPLFHNKERPRSTSYEVVFIYLSVKYRSGKLLISELLGDDSDSAGATQAISASRDHCLSVSLIVDATSSLNLASVTDSLLH